jgi:tetratricopeptide (TPR) repeat protein
VKISKCIVLAVALLAIPLASDPAPAQQTPEVSYARIARDSYSLNKVDAEQIEASLVGTPDDLQARTRLLGFYFGGAARLYGAETAIAHRRRHILWLIEHHPDSEVAGLSEATIDPAGHALADRQGYEQAAKLWIEAAQSPRSNAAVLGNAAKFFQLPDKERSAALINQAQKIAPDDKRWSERLGYVYALARRRFESEWPADPPQSGGGGRRFCQAGPPGAGEIDGSRHDWNRRSDCGPVRIDDGRDVCRHLPG